MTRSLAEHYATREYPASNAQILHGVYSKPGGSGVDEANLWGDYFYVEALMRLVQGEPTESFVLPTKLIVRRSCGAKKV